jgi:hypothetical protein
MKAISNIFYFSYEVFCIQALENQLALRTCRGKDMDSRGYGSPTRAWRRDLRQQAAEDLTLRAIPRSEATRNPSSCWLQSKRDSSLRSE